MAANGYCYTHSHQGLFPEIVEKIFTERVFYKKKMIEAKKDYEAIDRELKKRES
jgi:DNA polymerase elongation subunit (family B)